MFTFLQLKNTIMFSWICYISFVCGVFSFLILYNIIVAGFRAVNFNNNFNKNQKSQKKLNRLVIKNL